MPSDSYFVDKGGSPVIIHKIIYEGTSDGGSGTYTYGADQVDNDNQPRVVQEFFAAIRSMGRIEINNSQLGGDPMSGARKKCTIYYQMAPDRPKICQVAYEYESIDFKHHVTEIRYGGSLVRDPWVYQIFNRALSTAMQKVENRIGNFFSGPYADDAVYVSNNNCGGDTDVGNTKTVEVTVFDQQVPPVVVRAREGDRWPNLSDLHDALF